MTPENEITAPIRAPSITSAASYWAPLHLLQSAWLEHAPFAFWLIDATRPRNVVELGTHHGFSFFAFCQAVRTLGLQCACYAVDTWQGDEHAGFYGEEVFQQVSQLRQQHYGDIATLLRGTFDEALAYFAPGTIDLLHIDGRHTHADVLHDYTEWLPKLSPRAVVLFHDINVREREFGVWKLWHELKDRYPSFEFIHGHGLGVLAVGNCYPRALQPLLDAQLDAGSRSLVRATYSRLGKACSDAFEWSMELTEKNAESRALSDRLEAARQEIAQQAVTAAALRSALLVSQRELTQKTQGLAKLRSIAELHAREKYKLARQLRLREHASPQNVHPLALRIAVWAQAYPRRARLVWAGLRAFRMMVKLQFGPLMRAARDRWRAR